MIWRAATLLLAIGLAGCSQGTDANSRFADRFFEEMMINLPLQADTAAGHRPGATLSE
jgi:hypothetical protein